MRLSCKALLRSCQLSALPRTIRWADAHKALLGSCQLSALPRTIRWADAHKALLGSCHSLACPRPIRWGDADVEVHHGFQGQLKDVTSEAKSDATNITKMLNDMIGNDTPIRVSSSARRLPSASKALLITMQPVPIEDCLHWSIAVMRFGSIAKVRAKSKLEYYRISECVAWHVARAMMIRSGAARAMMIRSGAARSSLHTAQDRLAFIPCKMFWRPVRLSEVILRSKGVPRPARHWRPDQQSFSSVLRGIGRPARYQGPDQSHPAPDWRDARACGRHFESPAS